MLLPVHMLRPRKNPLSWQGHASVLTTKEHCIKLLFQACVLAEDIHAFQVIGWNTHK